MARCFITGVEMEIEDAWLLDLGVAYRVQLEFRQRLDAISRMIDQLAPQDDVQVYSPKTHTTVLMKHRRLVNTTVAKALNIARQNDPLFTRWPEWRSRRKQFKPDHNNTPAMDCSTDNEKVDSYNSAGDRE